MRTQNYYNTVWEFEADVKREDCRIVVNCTGIVHETNGISTGRARRDFYLIYMTEGEMSLEAEGKTGKIRRGGLVIIPPEVKHYYFAKPGETAEYRYIHFTGNEAGACLDKLGILPMHIYDVGVREELMQSWQQLFREFILNDEYFGETTQGILLCILTEFARAIKNVNLRSRLFRSMQYIHDHYSEDISVGQLDELERLSEPYFRKCFREACGESPNQYIINRRLAVAASLLTESEKSMTDIAEAAGFADVYYFGRMFKKKTGMTPGRFRRMKSKI